MGTVSLLTLVGKDVFLFKWQPSFLWSDACKKASKCNSPHTRLSLNLTSTCWSIFSKFSPCDLQVKDQGGYLHPAHPCVNHPHLKMKVTNKLQPLFILCCLSHLFHVNLAVSHYSYIMPPPFFFFVYPRLSFFVFLLLFFWACKVLNASALFFPPSADFEREDISGLFKALHGHKTNTNSLLPGDVQDAGEVNTTLQSAEAQLSFPCKGCKARCYSKPRDLPERRQGAVGHRCTGHPHGSHTAVLLCLC